MASITSQWSTLRVSIKMSIVVILESVCIKVNHTDPLKEEGEEGRNGRAGVRRERAAGEEVALLRRQVAGAAPRALARAARVFPPAAGGAALPRNAVRCAARCRVRRRRQHQLQQAEYVDVERIICACKLLLDVRSMEDVRKAWVYQTAAKTTRLDVYVDTEATRDCILAFANNQQLPLPTAVLPEQVPYAVPVAVSQAAVPSVDSQEVPSSPTNLKLLIDDSFQALADAQASMVKDNSHRDTRSMEDALEKYKAADEGFERAARLVSDERTRQLFQERRQEIQSVIRTLEDALDKQKKTNNCQPNAAVSLLMGITGMGFPEAPQPAGSVPSTANDTATANSSSAITTASELDERLERLKNFAAQQDVERAQREHKPAPDMLRLRLQALRNEKATAPSAESLEERFQRLRGGLATASPTGEETRGEATTFNRQSSVDRIIQQVQEEIALGIVDDELEDHDRSHDDSSDSDSENDDDSDDKSSNSSEEDDGRHRTSGTKANGTSASAKKSRR